MTPAQQQLVYAFLALQVLSVLLSAAAFWQARRAWRARESGRAAIEVARKDLLAVNRGVRAELRGARLQLSNVIQLLLAAGFKKKRQGWEEDFDETQLKESPPEMSWWRPKR